MKSFLSLIRWKNLTMIILTMVLMRYAVLGPLLGKTGVFLKDDPVKEVPVKLQFPLFDFVLLIAATVFIAAGGYVINDYFDIRTDLINRGKVIVGTKIPEKLAMIWHSILNVAGISMGFYISWRSGYLWLGILFLIVSGLLYFYSAGYKQQFLIGNIVVSVLTSLVPLLVGLYEWPALYKYYTMNAVSIPDINLVFYWIGGFSLFAFITTLAREIIKDIEDFDGDIAYGMNTMPIVIGIVPAKIVSGILILITILLLYLTWHFFINDIITLVYISALIVLPLIIVVYRLAVSRTGKQIHSASSMMKLVMLSGILYSVAVKIILTWNLF
jgi:4-hydroxybenzoate polyprenyltransferase